MDDAISRQAVLKLLSAMPPEEVTTKAILIQSVQQMNAAQPEVAKDTNVLTNDCISRQEAIDALRTHERKASKKWFDNQLDIEWNNAIDICCYDIEDLPPAQPEQRWILCSEMMPEEDNWMGAESRQYSDYVLMSVYNADDDEAFIDYGYTVDGNWQSDTTDCLVPPYWKVIAWMPLPEPYREDDHEAR